MHSEMSAAWFLVLCKHAQCLSALLQQISIKKGKLLSLRSTSYIIMGTISQVFYLQGTSSRPYLMLCKYYPYLNDDLDNYDIIINIYKII